MWKHYILKQEITMLDIIHSSLTWIWLMGAEVSKKWFESQNDLEFESWTKFCCLVSRQVRARNSSEISQEF